MKSKILNFINEILLNSGQYALFYILMNFSNDGHKYFNNSGHTLLLFILLFQTYILVIYGKIPVYRFTCSLIAPLFYTFIEMREGMSFVLNSGHIFFWVFSFLTGFIQMLYIVAKNKKIKNICEFSLTLTNVIIFLFIYFYFDLFLMYNEKVLSSEMTINEFRNSLEIQNLWKGIAPLFSDPAHIYIIFGGLILGITLAFERLKIIQLKDKINDLLGAYVDTNIRDKIIKNKSVSESKELTVLFSDIRNFTELSEKNPPDKVTEMLNLYFTEWNESIKKHGGIIDKFIGDAIMVTFGINHEQQNLNNPVYCAIEFIEKFSKLRQDLESKHLPVIQNIGIGINYGRVIVGDIGSSDRKNYTVIGDNVNIASRLEALCKSYNTNLIISEQIFENLDNNVKLLFEKLDTVLLKGKQKKTNIFGLKRTNI